MRKRVILRLPQTFEARISLSINFNFKTGHLTGWIGEESLQDGAYAPSMAALAEGLVAEGKNVECPIGDC